MSHSDDFERDDFDDDTPLSPEEEASLAEALRAALEPRELDPGLHQRILEQALSDPLAPASDDERRRADLLRESLAGRAESDDLALGRALRAAAVAEPAEVAIAAHERALARALPRRSNVVWAVFGAAGGALALAASIALLVSPVSRESAPAPSRSALLRSRSLAPLLNVEAKNLSPSERIDRIASVRQKDLRQNRYASWGLH